MTGERTSNPCNIAAGAWTHAGTGAYVNAAVYTLSSSCNVARPLACCANP